jgi:GT2 family glycosyltransferase
MQASVIIPYAGPRPMLRQQLDALETAVATTVDLECEVLVSCNSARDLAWTAQEVNRRGHAWLSWVDSTAVGGASYARNHAARCCTGELLLFCDADDVVDRRWIVAMCELVTPGTIVAGRLDFKLLNGPATCWWRQANASQLGQKFDHLPLGLSANLGIGRPLFEALSGFDEDLRVGEDIDLCWRAQYLGAKLIFAYDAVVNYRIREKTLDAFVQSFAYGQGDALLLSRHKNFGASRTLRRSSDAIRDVVLLTCIGVMKHEYRRMAVVRAAALLGRIIGSIRERVWAV